MVAVNLIGYSAMAGAVGGGGTGDLSIRYGYQRLQGDIMFFTVVILVAIVQGIQSLRQLVGRPAGIAASLLA